MAQAIHLLLFPIRFKNLSVLSSFPLTATFLQYALTVEPEGINSGQQWQQKRQQKPNGQARLSYLPQTYNAPSYLTLPLYFNPTLAPLPSKECWRIVTFSHKSPTLVSQEDQEVEEELGVSSGGRLHIPVGGDSSFVERENSGLKFHAVS